MTCAVFDNRALAVTELCPQTDFYDYQAKYTAGMTKHVLPADLPQAVEDKVKDYALRLHQALGCTMLSRSDFRYNDEDGVVLLEVNTNPGMTPLSLVPEQAKYAGMIEISLYKKIRNNLFQLFDYVSFACPPLWALHMVISVWRILQIFGPAFAARFYALWGEGTLMSWVNDIISVTYIFVPA